MHEPLHVTDRQAEERGGGSMQSGDGRVWTGELPEKTNILSDG